MIASSPLGVWFIAVRTGTGTDVFTRRLSEALRERGVRTEITWLPLRAEYAPWSVAVPEPPEWVNVVHINSWLHSRFVPKKIPVMTTFHFCVHDPDYYRYKSLLQKLYHSLWIRPIEKKNAKRSQAMTAVSRYTAEVVERTLGCGKVRAVHNWINSALFTPSEKKATGSRFRLLFAGKPSTRKGVDLLPKIMAQLGDDYELWCTCPEYVMNSHGLKNIICVGWQEQEADMIQVYRSCDALIFPSRMEGFGYVVLEAQACGLPVVCTNGTSLPEIVEHGVTGLLCPKDDVQAFVSAIRALPNVMDEMKNNCQKIVEERFTEALIINQYLDLYRGMIANRVDN